MFDYKIVTQERYEEACRKFALAHNMKELGMAAEMSVQVLRNKLNPDQPHKLTIEDLIVLTDLSQDPTLLDGLLAQLNCLPSVPANDVPADQLPLYVMKATAAIGNVAAEAISTEVMTASRKGVFTSSINSAIRCLTLASLAIHSRIQPTPVLASTVNAISGLCTSMALS